MKYIGLLLSFAVIGCTPTLKERPPIPEGKKGTIFIEIEEAIVDGRWLEINGFINNDTDKDLEWFEITCEFKDPRGQIVDSDRTIENQVVPPGGRKSWKIFQSSNGYKIKDIACSMTDRKITITKAQAIKEIRDNLNKAR